MGRPLGVPGDAAFQRRVLLAALRLLESPAGPVLAEYSEDAPQVESDETEGLACAVSFATAATAEGLAGAVQQEIAELAPWHELATRKHGRSIATLSGLTTSAAAKFLTDFVEVPSTPVYREGLNIELALRLAVQDLRAYYVEAAAAQPGARTALAAQKWLYQDTAFGQLLFKLRETCLASADQMVRTYGGKGLIPLAIGPRPGEWT
jgi:hypothetical protein